MFDTFKFINLNVLFVCRIDFSLFMFIWVETVTFLLFFTFIYIVFDIVILFIIIWFIWSYFNILMILIGQFIVNIKLIVCKVIKFILIFN